MLTVKVENMTSPRSYNKVANQFVIETPEGRYFQSYQSIIAFIPNEANQTELDAEAWNYSQTTAKYRSIFLNESTKETQKKIDKGEYLLVNLN